MALEDRVALVDDNADTDEIERVRRLIQQTELVGVRLVTVDAQAGDTDWSSPGNVAISPDGVHYRAEGHSIQVHFEHSVRYSGSDGEDLAHIVVGHVVEFSWLGDESVEEAQIPSEVVAAWIDRVVYFAAYPYVRAAIQNLGLELGIPVVVLGYLRQDLSPSRISLLPSIKMLIESGEPQDLISPP